MTKQYLNILLVLFISFLCSCTIEPEPINYGKDDCQYCKMKLMDKKYGCEIVTVNGKIYKYDDLNCMIRYVKDNAIDTSTIKLFLVIDFANETELIDAKTALYFESENLNSPMRANTAAFSSKADHEKFINNLNGGAVNWDFIYKKYN